MFYAFLFLLSGSVGAAPEYQDFDPVVAEEQAASGATGANGSSDSQGSGAGDDDFASDEDKPSDDDDEASELDDADEYEEVESGDAASNRAGEEADGELSFLQSEGATGQSSGEDATSVKASAEDSLLKEWPSFLIFMAVLALLLGAMRWFYSRS